MGEWSEIWLAWKNRQHTEQSDLSHNAVAIGLDSVYRVRLKLVVRHVHRNPLANDGGNYDGYSTGAEDVSFLFPSHIIPSQLVPFVRTTDEW